VLSVAFLSVACLLSHELAHGFAAICCGGGIRDFVLLSLTPHVSVSGVFTIAQNTWICAAGSAAELLFFLLTLVIAPRTGDGRLAIEVTGTFAAIELVGWTLSALAYPHGPRNTDVWQFLTSSGYHPMLVLAGCLSTAAIFLFAYRTRVRQRF
jgi:uncharacterized membrane protein